MICGLQDTARRKCFKFHRSARASSLPANQLARLLSRLFTYPPYNPLTHPQNSAPYGVNRNLNSVARVADSTARSCKPRNKILKKNGI